MIYKYFVGRILSDYINILPTNLHPMFVSNDNSWPNYFLTAVRKWFSSLIIATILAGEKKLYLEKPRSGCAYCNWVIAVPWSTRRTEGHAHTSFVTSSCIYGYCRPGVHPGALNSYQHSVCLAFPFPFPVTVIHLALINLTFPYWIQPPMSP